MLIWHYVLHDLPVETAYTGGVYWGKLVFPKEYPLKPPAIYMNTPSGRFETNARLCLSMSDFHPESWNPSWRIESILIGLVSFMLDTTEPRTTGGVHTSVAKRREFAKASFDFNRGNTVFRELFPEFCDESKKHPATGGFYLVEPPPEALKVIEAAAADATSGSRPSEHLDAVRPDGAGPGMPAVGPFFFVGRRLLVVSVLVFLASCIGLYAARAHR